MGERWKGENGKWRKNEKKKKKNGLREFWSYHTLICISSSSTLHYKL